MSEAQGRVGRWLRNKWHLDSLIAIGGMAAVYASTHRNGARAAIKMLHSQYTRNEQARRRFLAEGYAANKVGHRNAVLVLDDDTTEDGEVYLVMELLEGESLEGRLERVGVMSPMEVLELTDALLEVLACAHPKGILHRDIKPANIYLTRDGAVKLLDFGLARVRELSAEAMDQSDGIVFGTVSYIAPEQARADNQHLDARSDMWSIAATMFRALTGETVHPSTGPIIDRLLAVARKPPRSIATVLPRLPRPVIELVDRALAFDPEDRWPSANVMRVVVQDVMAQLREEAGEEEPEIAAPPQQQQRRATTQPPTRVRTDRELPAVRPGGALRPPDPQRPKTDPIALSARPRTLPPSDASPEDEQDLDVDALRERPEESRQRRSRTLLTREGRAELRRILDARKAAQASEEPVTNVAIPTPRLAPAAPSTPAESGSGDIDVDFDDSIIEVTIDHTGQGRHGPIAEPLADPVTPAPVSVESPAVSGDRSTRATGGFATVAPPPKTGGYAAVPGTPAPPKTGSHQAVPAAAGLEDSGRKPGGLTRSSPAQHGLDETERRRPSTTPVPLQHVPEDRRARTTSASYPTLGGATSRPFVPGDPHARPDEITRVGPAPVSGEIVDPAPPRAAEITRVGPAPVSGEIGTRTGETTRVGPPPAPTMPARTAEPQRPTTNLNDTLRPKTIPPISGRNYPPARPTPVTEPARMPEAQPDPRPAAPATAASAGPVAAQRPSQPAETQADEEPTLLPQRQVLEAAAAPEPSAADSATKLPTRAGMFNAPASRGPAAEPVKPVAGREPLPQRAPGTGAGEVPRPTSAFRPDTLLPRRAAPDATSKPEASEPPSASKPGAAIPDAARPQPTSARKSSPIAAPTETARPAGVTAPRSSAAPTEPARPVAVNPGAAKPVESTPTSAARTTGETPRPTAARANTATGETPRPNAGPASTQPRPASTQASPASTPAASKAGEPSTRAASKAGAPSPEPAAPARPAAKSMFNPYPTLAGDAASRRAGEPSGPKPAPRTGEPSGPKDSKASASTGPHTAAAPDPKASPTPEASAPARAPGERPKPGAAPVLPFSFLRSGTPRTSEPAPERPPGEPTDPTRKKP